MKLKIAFLQLVSEGNLEDNLEKGIKACREAKANGADITITLWKSMSQSLEIQGFCYVPMEF